MLFVGIDLGTSSVKLLLMDENGSILRTVSREYPLYFPKPGWSEQNPEDWYKETVEGLKELLADADKKDLKGISFGGQMHGLVMLDKDDKVIRPAILWNDSRSAAECDYLNNDIGKEKISSLTANIAFAGFTAPKILWVKNNEPENFGRIDKIMLPKDYLIYRLSGVHATDMSDASGMLLLNVRDRCYSDEMLRLCGISEKQLPKLFESYEPVGRLRTPICEELGCGDNVLIAAGAGDNAAAAIATGTIGDGCCNISLGTSGTIFISSKRFRVDEYNALHSFCDANGEYHLLACMLSAASCNKWWMEDILGTSDHEKEQGAIRTLGRNRVFYLPYLMGERSPLNDPFARAAFAGMTMDSTRSDMTQAVLEGVAFALRDSFEVAGKLSIDIKRSRIVGGGARSELWRNIVANVLGIPLDLLKSEEGPSLGGAMLAAVACGAFKDVQEAVEKVVRVVDTVEPDREISVLYEERYQAFGRIYPALKDVFPALT